VLAHLKGIAMSNVGSAVEDPKRLAALRRADLLDTPPEESFDQLTRLAARLLGAPMALVSLVDKDRQFFKSSSGPLPERQTPLSYSFCQHAVASKEPLLVEDAREDPVFKDNLAVRDRGVIAYAGIPLITPEGHALGTLCVFDSKPRTWAAEQIENLRALASSVMSTITYRAAARTQQPAAPETGVVSEAADVLSDAATEYLNSLTSYDQCIGDKKRAGQEIECQNAVLSAEGRLRQVTQDFQEALEKPGVKRDDPNLQPAVELWQACVTYFNAEKRRAEVSERFRAVQAALAEVEQEVMLATSAEHAMRLASRTYKLRAE
jgi:hypothetical protein